MPDWRIYINERFPKLGFNPAREKEIVDELSQHLADRYQELRTAGTSHEDAIRAAIDEIDVAVLDREMRRLRQASAPDPVIAGTSSVHFAADFGRDVIYAARMLLKQRGFTIAAVLTLALGIGMNTAIFSLINATLLRHLPFQNRDRLFYLYSGPVPTTLSYPAYEAIRDGNRSLDELAAWGGITASLNTDGETGLVTGAIVTGNYFQALGVGAERGRTLLPSDDVMPNAHPVAVISHRLWQSRFGGRPDIIGHTILLNARSFTVVGVTGPDFPSAQQGVVRDLYVPMMMQALMRPPRAGYSGDMNPDLLKTPSNSWLLTVGLLKPGVVARQAEADLAAVVTGYVRTLNPKARDQRVMLVNVDDGDPAQRESMGSAAKLLVAVVASILLIGCANVANLLLAKASSRRRELAVRLAIGASRKRLVRQLLTESLLLALGGGAAGIALAFALVAAYRAAPPPAGVLPVAIDFTIDHRVLFFTTVLSLLTGIAFGLVPALQASNPGIAPALKEDSFVPDEKGRRGSIKKVLVVVEVALSLILLVTAGLFMRSLRTSQQVDPGVAADELLSASLNINLLRYTRAQGRDFYRKVVEQVESLPGVSSASVARVAVLTGAGRVTSINIEGRRAGDSQYASEGSGTNADNTDSARANVVGLNFFKTLGIPLVRGRDFTDGDTENRPLVAVVSEAFVRRFFPNEEPIGKRFCTIAGPEPDWTEIVGIVRDSKYTALSEDPQPVVYVPIGQQHETGVTLYVRATMPPETLIATVRKTIQTLEPNLPVPDIQTMNDTIGLSLYLPRMAAWLIGTLGGLALLLALIGVYGVMSFAISKRTKELGIRMALGADSKKVLALVVREGMGLVAAGTLVGLAGALSLSRLLSRFLFGVGAYDPLTYIAVPALLGLVGLAACYLPARRATTVDPIKAIREV